MGSTTIEVKDETWQRLNRRKSPGESFNDVIQEMMDGAESVE